MEFDIEYLEKLAKLVHDNNLNEITLENEDFMVSLKREKQAEKVVSLSQGLGNTITSQVVSPVQKNAVEVKNVAEKKGKPIVSPMVGTFYSSPSPDEKPFVSVGDSISSGQIVCIIEAMKLMNEIESDVSGKITEICVKNGESVEFGQILMYVE